ncbi:hypothetical protein EVAR_56301_1 [Eumeta japonica]|uniref:Uncharacterized protein n=1 Tax=Eumeta variegata TaxID=151549 RepID=A0A4C1YZD6_EUMVA|nr:hypothetical protein EVAR_56301_1 [Eumeta japonica]
MFDHRRIPSYNWGRGKDKSMIDFIIVDDQLKSKVVDTIAEDNVIATEYMFDDENEITMDEIIKVLKRMKVGKATGYDRVSLEMLRGGGDIVANVLYHVECSIGHGVPKDWCRSVVVPL